MVNEDLEWRIVADLGHQNGERSTVEPATGLHVHRVR
jgi:hypothetical protein